MKHFNYVLCPLAIALMSLAPAAAQQPGQLQSPASQQPVTQQTSDSAAGQIDSATRGTLFRASQLIGMGIQNNAGKDVGNINDLVLDASTGKIHYAAVTYGGFLGIGNKMFAVPFEAFKFQRDPKDAERSVLVLNVTEQQMEGAEGFDEKNWPDFANNNFTSDLDRRYGVDRQRLRDRSGRVDVDINRKGVDVDIDRSERNK